MKESWRLSVVVVVDDGKELEIGICSASSFVPNLGARQPSQRFVVLVAVSHAHTKELTPTTFPKDRSVSLLDLLCGRTTTASLFRTNQISVNRDNLTVMSSKMEVEETSSGERVAVHPVSS